jgi:hypothetical protein
MYAADARIKRSHHEHGGTIPRKPQNQIGAKPDGHHRSDPCNGRNSLARQKSLNESAIQAVDRNLTSENELHQQQPEVRAPEWFESICD